jgi:hypothetical protein
METKSMKITGMEDRAARAYILLLIFGVASCFQIDPIDVTPEAVDAPPVIDYRWVYPEPHKVIKLFKPGTPSTFTIPRIYDGSGASQEELYGRYWIDHDPEAVLATYGTISLERRASETPGEDADTSTDADDEYACPECYWEGSFTVDHSAFTTFGCHQVMAVISDSRWVDCPGYTCTEKPTILARTIWWVWVSDSTRPDDEPPALNKCGEVWTVNSP